MSLLAISVAPARALDNEGLNEQLLKLDPKTRLEQTCDAEVMTRINRDEKDFRVDKVIAYTFSEPVMEKDAIHARGAVFRSHGSWYRLAYDCRTGPRHLDARTLIYRIGSEVPRQDWDRYFLYD